MNKRGKHNIIHSRKAQIIGQVFIFILAAAIFILILTYGYRAIAGFGERSEQVALIEFQTKLESSIKSIMLDYGSVKKHEAVLPTTFTEVCFVDLTKNIPPAFEDEHPLMASAWQDGTQNIFLVPFSETPLHADNIALEQNPEQLNHDDSYLCIDIVKGKFALRLEGLGNAAGISEWK